MELYGVYRSRAMRNAWFLLELGIDFKHVPIIQYYRVKNRPDNTLIHTRSPEFLRINPNGHIPSLKDGTLILHESMAINLYLAEKYPSELSAKTLEEKGLLNMWTLWAATEYEPFSVISLQNRLSLPENERDLKKAENAEQALIAPMQVLENHLDKNPYILGKRFTLADIQVAEVCRYAQHVRGLWQNAPKVEHWLKTCHARPAYQEVWRRRTHEAE